MTISIDRLTVIMDTAEILLDSAQSGGDAQDAFELHTNDDELDSIAEYLIVLHTDIYAEAYKTQQNKGTTGHER